jgi:hypothetical protein
MSVTLHTTLGDIKLEIFCDEARKFPSFEARGSNWDWKGGCHLRCVGLIGVRFGVCREESTSVLLQVISLNSMLYKESCEQ